MTSGTILEEPLYLEKDHFATLLASPFVAVPLWILHEIVEGTRIYEGRLVRLNTNHGQLRKVRRKVADFVNEPIFEEPPGPQTSYQEAETRTVVRHEQELSVGKISELHRVLLRRYAADKVAKKGVFSSKRIMSRESKRRLYGSKSVSAMRIESHEHTQQVSARCVELSPRYRRCKMLFFDPSEFQCSR